MRKLSWLIILNLLSLNLIAPVINGKLSKTLHQSALRKIILEQKEKSFYDTFSPQLFYEALLFSDLQHPDIVFRQAVLETGWFTSSLFKDYNNPFGMKEPKCRETLCDSTALGHGSFDHWFNAVKDYKMWQDYWIDTIYNTEQYYHFLDTLPYAEAKRYTQILRQMKIDDLVDLPVS